MMVAGGRRPIVLIYRSRCTYRARLSLTGIATPVDKRARRPNPRCSNMHEVFECRGSMAMSRPRTGYC
ncbi:hypothetical protein IEO21_07196 [Rhodonia placenta]|uniref:Uncharacterized protein n=1 Tax=Rhodonia placenta TaxID=104341 RepID=A0A8H7NYJ7_9APHY|nr:hypothetical protein IEO21_07196 [Postia placenta]